MPNRIIKDSIHESEKVNAMTDFQFRLWISLITYVDDYGRGDARPSIIKGNCFPLRERLTNKDIEAGLAGLAGIGCIVLYEIDGRPYLYFPNWEKHQTIRNKRSKFPEPPQTSESICKQVITNASLIQSNPNTNPNPNTKCVTRFAPPTEEEVREYCKERGNHVDAGRFVAYYESNGWRVGKNPMKDWKAAVRTWERDDNHKKPAFQGASHKEATASDLDRMRKFVEKLGGAT